MLVRQIFYLLGLCATAGPHLIFHYYQTIRQQILEAYNDMTIAVDVQGYKEIENAVLMHREDSLAANNLYDLKAVANFQAPIHTLKVLSELGMR